MTDLLTATQDAFVAALKASVPPTLATVLQHIPENAQPPLIVVGNISATNISGKDGGLEQHTVEVVSFFRGSARRNLYAIMHAARSAIESADLAADGALFGDAVWQSSEDDIGEDGVTYQGIQTFEIIVQPDEE